MVSYDKFFVENWHELTLGCKFQACKLKRMASLMIQKSKTKAKMHGPKEKKVHAKFHMVKSLVTVPMVQLLLLELLLVVL